MIGRVAETDWLRSHLADSGEVLLVLYGRRRVGKTTLVTSVFDTLDRPTFYYLCDERGTAQNARRFAEQCADTLDDIPPDVDGFVDAFEYLVQRLDGSAVVALDEFSSLVDENETVPSVARSSWTSVRPSVLFPDPDSPTSPKVSPRLISKLTLSTAFTGGSAKMPSPP